MKKAKKLQTKIASMKSKTEKNIAQFKVLLIDQKRKCSDLKKRSENERKKLITKCEIMNQKESIAWDKEQERGGAEHPPL